MNYVGKLLSNFKGFYNEINSATLTGAIDVVIVKQKDGSYVSSPWHVRFGKMGVLRAREKVVDIEINDEPVELHMKLGEAGEAFFVQQADEPWEGPAHLATSPLPDTLELMEQGLQQLKRRHSLGEGTEASTMDAATGMRPRVVLARSGRTDMAEEAEVAEVAGAGAVGAGLAAATVVTHEGLIDDGEVHTDSLTEADKQVLEPLSIIIGGDAPEDDGASVVVPTSGASRCDEGSPKDLTPKQYFEEYQGLNVVGSPHPRKTPSPKPAGVSSDDSSARKGVDMSTQTDMTAEQVQHKAHSNSRSRVSSGDSCKSASSVSVGAKSSVTGIATDLVASPKSSSSSTDTVSISKRDATSVSPHRKDPLSQKPAVIKEEQSSPGGATKDKVVVKSKRRRKRKCDTRPSRKTSSESSLGSTSQQVAPGPVATETGQSADAAEDPMFEMDFDEDEVDNADTPDTMMPLMMLGRTVSMPVIDDRHKRTEEWASSHYASAFHPFSDGDITPLISPMGSRPPTPKSDTEYETQKYDATAQTHLTGDNLVTIDDVKWRWGELPESSTSILAKEPSTPLAPEDDKSSGMGLFHFMRQTKKIRHQPQQGGIYLDDLSLEDMDPEVAALYIYPKQSPTSLRGLKDEDDESGRGASLPQSPVTVDTGGHDLLRPLAHKSATGLPAIALSLCGGLKDAEGTIPEDRFLVTEVTYDKFSEDPNILNDPNLVLKMGSKYYNWQIAAPMLMSILAFQRPLPESTVDKLVKHYMPKKERRRGWFSWGRGGEIKDAQQQQTQQHPITKDQATSPPSSAPSSAPNSPFKAKKKNRKERKDTDGARSHDDGFSSDDESEGSSKDARGHKADYSVTIDMDSIAAEEPGQVYQDSFPVIEKYKKSLKLTSEEIECLNLREGVNEATFSVTTQYQGTTRCTSCIFLWNWDDRIIVSDIDGTITKSDVLGHVFPLIGKDWSQAGIANLYSMIHDNGYKFLYLSARAIGQSKITRDYLKSIRQGALKLPDGPLLLSPSSLISAFHKEVIERKPEEFKISCLSNIQKTFPDSRNPFYAGFGNKVNDVYAYRAVKIPIQRIFTVNPKGELRLELMHTFQSTYTKLSDVVDHIFPPLVAHRTSKGRVASGNFPSPDKYSNFTYWRDPLPNIDLELDSFLKKDATTGPTATATAAANAAVTASSAPAAEKQKK